jgi:hypothetical protein
MRRFLHVSEHEPGRAIVFAFGLFWLVTSLVALLLLGRGPQTG